MSAGVWFWIIYVVVLLLGGFLGFRDERYRPYIWPGLVVYVLIGLLGWGMWGAPLK